MVSSGVVRLESSGVVRFESSGVVRLESSLRRHLFRDRITYDDWPFVSFCFVLADIILQDAWTFRKELPCPFFCSIIAKVGLMRSLKRWLQGKMATEGRFQAYYP